MGVGAVAEPFVVISLLIGGTWINRYYEPIYSKDPETQPLELKGPPEHPEHRSSLSSDDTLMGDVEAQRSFSPSRLAELEPKWRKRTLSLWGRTHEVTTPNTRRFQGTILSRVLKKFPFLAECWYWALIYWIYQLGRAASALWMVQGTVETARAHALQVIWLEEQLHIFHELDIQAFFLQYPTAIHWINRIYSFIHIPGSIAFLIWLFYSCTIRAPRSSYEKAAPAEAATLAASPRLYESRRRTMAFCNLLAFVIFTLWPCMPPRLLSSDDSSGDAGDLARSYGFVDTVHGVAGESSVWTQNKFCNQYAAMPSLHFGYSLLIGITVFTFPLTSSQRYRMSVRIPLFGKVLMFRLPSWRKMLAVFIGVAYPMLILTAILATANHFILDAVAGSIVCAIAFWANDVLLNLLAVEDYFLWLVRIHKPER